MEMLSVAKEWEIQLNRYKSKEIHFTLTEHTETIRHQGTVNMTTPDIKVFFSLFCFLVSSLLSRL